MAAWALLLLVVLVLLLMICSPAAATAAACDPPAAPPLDPSPKGTNTSWMGLLSLQSLQESSLLSGAMFPIMALLTSAPIALVTYLISRCGTKLQHTLYTTVTIYSDTQVFDWFAVWLQDQPQVIAGESQVDLVESQEVGPSRRPRGSSMRIDLGWGVVCLAPRASSMRCNAPSSLDRPSRPRWRSAQALTASRLSPS
jgi:hypothetical protein